MCVCIYIYIYTHTHTFIPKVDNTITEENTFSIQNWACLNDKWPIYQCSPGSLVLLLHYSFSLCDPLLILRPAYPDPYCAFHMCPSGFLFPSYCHIINYHTFNGKETLILTLMNLQIDCSSAHLEWAWLGSSAPKCGLSSDQLCMCFVLGPRMKELFIFMVGGRSSFPEHK